MQTKTNHRHLERQARYLDEKATRLVRLFHKHPERMAGGEVNRGQRERMGPGGKEAQAGAAGYDAASHRKTGQRRRVASGLGVAAPASRGSSWRVAAPPLHGRRWHSANASTHCHR